MKEKQFTISSTNSCKGIALLLLLWHHLFCTHPEYGFITYKIAFLAKVCVAIFVILSGYGFSESVKSKHIGLFAFYKRRLAALYFNYWFIAILFVPIGILFMDRTLQDAFTSHAYVKFIIQMTGLHRFAYSEYGYNATWWYMSVIIPLTILFPFIYDLTRKYGVLILIFCLVILLPKRHLFPVINTWLLPFVLGIYFSQRNHFVNISNRLKAYGAWRFIILIAAILLVAAFENRLPLLRYTELDWLFGVVIIFFVFELTSAFGFIEKTLSFLGEHLFNVFLFHTFIYYYYWSEFIYYFQNPLLIFLALLSICVVISLMIEQIKRRVYFYGLVEKVNRVQVPCNIEIPFRQDAAEDASASRR